jgi:hypothetical protein
MTLLKRATIKSYDAGTHRATVGISGSLSVWLAGLAVSDGIAAASVVVGRECAVLFHTEDNPDDAVVISVHGGGPPAAGGDVSGPASSTDNALARFNGAGGKTIQDSGSTLDDGGNLSLQKNLGVRTAAPTGDANFITCSPTLNLTADLEALKVSPVVDINASPNINVYAIRGLLTGKVSGGGSYGLIAGLDYVVAPFSDGTGTQTVGSLIGAQAGVQTIRTLGTLNITEAIALQAYGFLSALGVGTTITDLIGVNIQGPYGSVLGGITNATGLRIQHIAYGTNKYLIHAFRDATNTSLRLDAGNPPDAALTTEGDSQLYLAWMENGTVNVRPVRWRRQSSLAATDKVLIAA